MKKSDGMLNCLNLGAGKINPERYSKYRNTVHVDQCYNKDCCAEIGEISKLLYSHEDGGRSYFCKSNIFDFIDTFPHKFDIVFAERIFEHMDYTTLEIGRLLEGINSITTNDAELTIVVPNAILLANMLISYENQCDHRDHIKDLNTKLIINTEFNNFRHDPHCSIWTPKLAHEYIESEGTWKIIGIEEQVMFAGRNIYMRIFCSKQ